ncbi:MAG: TadE/TadG family type IV pilus assembly protein [Pseudomonadota bacterium]
MIDKFRISLKRFRRDTEGAATVEFVILFLPFMSLIFFIFEVAIAYHWALSAQKAVEQGARAATVRAPVATSLIRTTGFGDAVIQRPKIAGALDGGACYLGNCEVVPTVSCTGGAQLGAACDADQFNEIFQVVRKLAYNVDPEDVTITYEDVLLGYAGDPYVPLVTVSIRQRERTVISLSRLFFNTEKVSAKDGAQTVALSAAEDQTQFNPDLPMVSASLVAEDLKD